MIHSALLLMLAGAPGTFVVRHWEPGYMPDPLWGRTTWTMTLRPDLTASLTAVTEQPPEALRRQQALSWWAVEKVEREEWSGTWKRAGSGVKVDLGAVQVSCVPSTVTVHAANATVAYVNDCTPCYDKACAKPPKWTPARVRKAEVLSCTLEGSTKLHWPTEHSAFSAAPGLEWLNGDSDCPPTGWRDVGVDRPAPDAGVTQ